jgi:lipopolysaccharide transport system permease protein
MPSRRGRPHGPKEAAVREAAPEIVIRHGVAERNYWRDLWAKRELIYFLAWRDVIVKYKQTIVGLLWVLIRPMFTLLVFTLVFGKIAALPSSNVPYPLLVFSGLMPWLFFAATVNDVSNSVQSNAALVGKIYFPRLIITISVLVVCLVDYAVSCLLIVVVALWTGVPPDLRILYLPVLTLWVAAFGYGLGLCGAALNVRYRDFRHLIPFLLQLGVYVSPVGYSASLVPEKWRWLYSLNPMTGIIDGFRWAILGQRFDVYVPGMVFSIVATAAVLGLGLYWFRHVERQFVDFL